MIKYEYIRQIKSDLQEIEKYLNKRDIFQELLINLEFNTFDKKDMKKQIKNFNKIIKWRKKRLISSINRVIE